MSDLALASYVVILIPKQPMQFLVFARQHETDSTSHVLTGYHQLHNCSWCN